MVFALISCLCLSFCCFFGCLFTSGFFFSYEEDEEPEEEDTCIFDFLVFFCGTRVLETRVATVNLSLRDSRC